MLWADKLETSIEDRTMRRVLSVGIVLAVALQGCTAADWLRGTLGGADSDQASMTRTSAKNGVFSGFGVSDTPAPSIRD